MSLDSLADAISIGTLLAFNLVNSGVMIVRYTGPNKYPFLPLIFIALYVLFCFLSALGYVQDINLAMPIVFSVLALGMFVALCVYHFRCKGQNIPETFKCPLVPLVPCVGIAINSYMLAGLNGWAWIRLLVWLVLGLLVYLIYGIRSSKMRLYNLKKKSDSVN